MTPLHVWFFRHGEVTSHRGDLPLTESGMQDAEAAGRRLAGELAPGARVEFLHAPTRRTVQTLEALRRGARDALDPEAGVRLGAPRVEHAVRNPDLYVAGTRVEMVSSAEALAAQLPDGLLTADQVAQVDFFARFWATHDRIRVWLHDPDPPGERAADVARRFLTFARSLTDVAAEHPRHYVCVTHSGPMRAVLCRYVLDHDPGEPEYVEPIELAISASGDTTWRFRQTVNTGR